MSNTEVKSYYAGSSWGLPPVRYGKCQVIGSLAQLGEHLPYKQRVIGSIPIASTTKNFEAIRGFFLSKKWY